MLLCHIIGSIISGTDCGDGSLITVYYEAVMRLLKTNVFLMHLNQDNADVLKISTDT